ncbi:hypothetical protein EKO27_g8402 [Xylaria grammica]|uniref:Uncharacterized protein n=1 Tax=Xylaria grammica TaxID=363999 RepID=A0A439CWW0_9PEZI|nr:hypothetical protein EKO27_g8402 [Xylaria grammica]
MASSIAISTPSPPGSVHTPGTPKHGYSDSWEPFSPRKSARISSRQQSTKRTPSPRSSPKSTRSSTKPSTLFSTPATSPIKKRQPTMDSVRRASGTLTAKGTANAASSLGISPKPQQKSQGAISTSHSAGMLPTPAKTPRKQPNAKTEAATHTIARNLFVTEGDMLTPKKKAKKYTGLTLDSFRAEDMEENIEIFTDTRDQFPEVDESADNPFYGDHAVAEPSKRRSKRKPIVVPGEGRQSVEDAVKRSDGVLVVFRGKKMFRKFSDENDADDSSQAEGDEVADLGFDGEARRNRPMTRSSIKPRLLFPSASKGKKVVTTAEDEEAVTDIEDNVFQDTQDADIQEVPQTPAHIAKGKAETPKAPRFAPSSPPSTGRATRSTDKLRGGDTPMKAKVPSPFDGWRRSKRGALAQGQKREGDVLETSSKRQRA